MEYPCIIVDTNIFIEHQRKQKKENSKLTKLVKQYDPLTTSVTVYELFAGAVTPALENDVRKLLLGLDILSLDAESAEIAARERMRLVKQNKQFDVRDILIAGIVLKHKLPLATLNQKHFVDFWGLQIVEID